MESADCTERKRKGILGLNHSFNFALNMGLEKRLARNISSEKHEPFLSFHHFVFSSCLLRGCQGNKLPIIRPVYIARDTDRHYEEARCRQPLCTWCYMTIAVYVQMMSTSTQQSCKLCNNSCQSRTTFYPVLTEFVLHL